ncbi:MAG: type I 3-dehydroquinate dehydratase [Treponemataceae bacterium]
MATKVCLVLTEETLENNLQLAKEYKGYYDILELRVDLLFSNETFYVRKFPALANVPTILTCRRISDGGKFKNGEGARLTLLAKALAFLDNDRRKNFAYVDFESDFPSSALEEAAKAFDIKIIRSLHNLKTPLSNIVKELDAIRKTEDEIVKLATVVPTLADLTALFLQSPNANKPYIVSGLGKYGALSRIFSQRLGSEIVYTFSEKYIKKNHLQGELIDPISLSEVYGFRISGDQPKIYAVVGEYVHKSKSPQIHNAAFQKENISACYVPISTNCFSDFFRFAKKLNIQGVSITSPFKKDAYNVANDIKGVAKEFDAINTLANNNGTWTGYNTDVIGFEKALLEFLGNEKIEEQKIAVLGAGGAAEAVCFAIFKMLKAKFAKQSNMDKPQFKKHVCVFNRTKNKAENLANRYGFSVSALENDDSVVAKLLEFSSLIINCTSVGSNKKENLDPISFYNFTGNEKVFDLIYEPKRTKLLQRARKSGCKICNGYRMLELQAIEQFKIFTGRNL